ncbi:transcription termination factor NusA [Candidatus Epulonipiscium fishelsonii]|uniref:Transcription termination factor NusA n=1 Tax=Candidatus Epulonipiscium fishelsonii TaxID=77094 RepID=A0ACC8XG69_9FIRM|nr:transcription termination factor NusA [Epulopiscium sp. SCG-B11WGA-EpuloA1]ONI42872.1 transcription termination factor NusA [Epulopiscium sp. SCG-B05WGA-EpuloA1]
MNSEFITAIDQIAESKGIDREKLFEAIKQSIEAACKKHFGSAGSKQIIKVDINKLTGDVKVFSTKTIVEDDDVDNELILIGITEAKLKSPFVEVGDLIDIEITPRNFGRIAAQNAKQVVIQKIKEAERQMIYEEYSVKLNDIIRGRILRREKNGYLVQLEFTEASLPLTESVPSENYESEKFLSHNRDFYLLNVKDFSKNDQKEGKSKNSAQVILSRTHPDLVKRLFEREVIEIKEKTVEIKSVAREAGSRTKIAVHSNNPKVDPVGACVGEKGYRINLVVEELCGEKIDVVRWSEDPRTFIEAALSPAKVSSVEIEQIDTERGIERNAKVLVPENVLTLAIGKGGQNVRLAAKLTGWKIDIKSE